MTYYTLRLHMADGSAFAYTGYYLEVDEIVRDIQKRRWVHAEVRDKRRPTGAAHMHINPKQVCHMELYAEGEESRTKGWTYAEAVR